MQLSQMFVSVSSVRFVPHKPEMAYKKKNFYDLVSIDPQFIHVNMCLES